MGGLAGLIHFDGPAPDPQAVQAMADAHASRGPDGFGEFAEGPIAMVHRLRRVRTVQAVQPCVHGHLVVVLDGWLFDQAELGAELGLPDGMSDTEVLAHAWARWGREALPRLEGEFAFAVWDRQRKRLVMARDRMGTRPLYWAERSGRAAFASSILALLQMPWISKDLDPSRLAEYLSFQVVHAPRTLLRQVHQVEPGCIVEIADGWTQTRRYWFIRYAPVGQRPPPDAEVVERIRATIGAAVQRRIASGVPTGLFLSGGLGSTALAAALTRQRKRIPTFSVAFSDDPFPETPFAGRVATIFDLPNQAILVDGPELAASFDDVVAALGHPVGHAAVFLQYAMSQVAGKSVRVALGGNGGESLFGGRQLEGLPWDLTLASVFNRLPQALLTPLTPWLQQSASGRRLATPPADYPLALGLGGADLFATEERTALLQDPAWVRPNVRQDVLSPWYVDLDTDPINMVLHGYLRSVLGERALPRADRTAAAAGLDVRFPLLDTAVVEAAAALPGWAKIRRVGSQVVARWPLRGLLEGVLPATLLDRPKRSLPVPLGSWLAGPGRLFLENRFRKLKEDPLGLWQPAALDALRADVRRSNAAGNRLWTLFILDAWLRS